MAQEDPITDKLSTLVTLPIQTYDNSPDNLRIISDVVIKPLSDTSFYIVDPNDATNNGNLVQLLNNNNNNNLILLNIPTDEPINNRNDTELVKSTSLDVIVEKTNDNTKPITIYRCTRCDEEFKKFNLYKKHIMWHNNMKKFKCDKCSISYNIEENLNIHRAVHNDGKPTCPICKISFQRLASLKSHLIVHQIEELYKCEECLSEFEREEELGKHLQTHLSTAKEKDGTVCSYCRVKFTDSNLYKEHIAHHVKVKKMILPGRRARRNQHKREYNHCCGVCQKSFSKASLLERHSRVHSGEKPFICHYCNRGFNQKGALQIHVTKHTGIKPYCCTLCSAEFYQKGNLRVHVEKTHTAPLPGVQTYKCSHCPCIFKKVSSLNVHITKTHVNNQNQPNNMIDLTINRSKSIETINDCDNRGNNNNNNNKQENGNDNINYIRVAESFSDGTTRRYLIKQKRVNNTRIYICNYCPKEFKKPSDLIRHTRVHTRERPFLCKYCNIAFSLKSTLLSHLKTHSGKCHYSCPVCMKKFSTSRALNLHIKTHPDQLTQPFKCNPCNKWFSSVQKMLLHKEKHHGQYEDCIETPIVVEPVKIVGDLNIESTTIKQQASSLSPNDEQYECQICKQRFSKLCNLKQHMNIHLNDKNCKCDECQKLFSTADALKEHKSLYHNNSRLYHCSDCNRKFTSLSLLKQHRSSPTLPYKCSYCDRAFCTILLYRRHVIVHKNNGDFDENRTNSSTIDPDSMINSDNLSINNNSNDNEINRKYEENIQQEENSILDQHLYQLIPNQIQITTTANNNNNNNNSNSGDNIKGKDQVQILINCDDLQFGDNGHLYTKNDEGTDSTFFNHLDFQDGNVFNIDNLNNEFEHILNTTNNIIDNNNKSGHLNENLLNNSVENFSTPIANVIVDPSSLSIFNNNNLQSDNSNTNDNDVKLNSEKMEKNKNKRKYICPYCRRTITNKSTYSKHLDNHIKRKKDEPVLRICNYCNKSFKKQSDLVRHIRTHTGERPFSCDECDKSFSLKSTLLSHQRTHNPINSKKILCSICNSSFTSKSSLKVHMSLHTGIKPFDCTYCPMKFRTLSHKKYHEASQHHCSVNNSEEELLRIKTIDRDFLSSNLINENQSDMITSNVVTEQHLNETNDNILVVQESLQLPILINDDNLNLNESVQLESNILQWSNNLLLQDTLLQPSSLIQLDDGTLLNIKTINNDIDLVTNQNLVENQLINNQQEEEQQQAPAQSQQQQQQQQIDTVNGKPRTFKCDICNKMYASKDVLRRHRKNHGINKKFPCSKCDKGFDTEDALEKHSKLHSGYRPYTCMYCNNSFSKQQSLSAHMKRIHKLPNNSWKNDVFFTFST